MRQSARTIVAEWQNQDPGSPSERWVSHESLDREQLESLRRCADGISLRFEAIANVEPLIRCGYAARRLAGVVVVTRKGHAYLRKHGL